MKLSSDSNRCFYAGLSSLFVIVMNTADAGIVTWTNSTGSGDWHNPQNWNTAVTPSSTSDVVFPANLSGNIMFEGRLSLSAANLTFENSYTLKEYNSIPTALPLSGGEIRVGAGATATLALQIQTAGGLTKTGAGSLILNGTTIPGATTISEGLLRTRGLGTSPVMVHPGATLEIEGSSHFWSPITLMNGAAFTSIGDSPVSGMSADIAIHPDAESVSIATRNASDTLTFGSTGAGLSGGASFSVIGMSGPGTIRLAGAGQLPAGSLISGEGGTLELFMPVLPAGNSVDLAPALNPLGQAGISHRSGTLKFLIRASNAAAVQDIVLPVSAPFSFGGASTLSIENYSSSSYQNKTFVFPGMTLAANTDLLFRTDMSHAVRLSGPLRLEGNATVGVSSPSHGSSARLIFGGGITGGANDKLTIQGGGTNAFTLAVNASGTYGGGTVMTGGAVSLNAESALGTGPLTLNGGSLYVNVPEALNGPVSIQGGVLTTKHANSLASNPVTLNNGFLWFSMPDPGVISIPSLTVSGTSRIGFNTLDFLSGEDVVLPLLQTSGSTILLTEGQSGAYDNARIQNLSLGGDLVLNTQTPTFLGAITEDNSPRKLLKVGVDRSLTLEGPSTHSGGTEVRQGLLFVKHPQALGSGNLVLGATEGPVSDVSFTYGGTVTGLPLTNDIRIQAGNSGWVRVTADSGPLNGNIQLDRSVILGGGTFNGLISGPGSITTNGVGEIVLTNTGNSFGSGLADSVSVFGGKLVVKEDALLGNPVNGITLLGGQYGALKIGESFSTSRVITLGGTAGGTIEVVPGKEFTINTPLAGTLALSKTGGGTLVLPPGLDSRARGTAATTIQGGILRLQSSKGLSDGGEIKLSGTDPILELRSDANTSFSNNLTTELDTARVHVDRAVGGSATGGRHSLGASKLTSLYVTGDHGYGLSLGATTMALPEALNTLHNDAPADLVLASIGVATDPTWARRIVVSGSGDTVISGAITKSGSGGFSFLKRGTGKLRLGTNASGLSNGALEVYEGEVDLNGLNTPVSYVYMGFNQMTRSARITTGAAGSLNLSGSVYCPPNEAPTGAEIVGNVSLGSATRFFEIWNAPLPAVDLVVDGPITGISTAGMSKTGTGTLRFAGSTANTYPGATGVSSGVLELAKTSANAISGSALNLTGTGIVRLLANEQIANATPVTVTGSTESLYLDLNNFTETLGNITVTQADHADYAAVRTGASGRLVLNGSLSLNNNTNGTGTNARNILVTGTGTKAEPSSSGILDLGGAVRTIQVGSTTTGANAAKAAATIETAIINGGILKTGKGTLQLDNSSNQINGGIQIAEGILRPSGPNVLGIGGVTILGTPGTSAGIDFSRVIGFGSAITVGGSGDFALTHAAPAPELLVLSGNITLQRALNVDVVNGTRDAAQSATLYLKGRFGDTDQVHGLVKKGNGVLRLNNGNNYEGDTIINKGTLQIADASSLGLGSAPVILDGGCLGFTGSHALGKAVQIAAGGGTIFGTAPHVLDLSGQVLWNDGTSGFFGTGAVVLSGATAGSGDVWLGTPTDFAPAAVSAEPLGFTLALRGSAALPSGNLKMDNLAVLELGNGDFTRPLGTGPGQVSLATGKGAGWAAHGADRVVNLGGAGETITWGPETPAFLYSHIPGLGALLLGSATGTHTVDFQNSLELHNADQSHLFKVITNDGPAGVDAEISGDLSYTGSGDGTTLELSGTGTLDLSGDITTGVSILKKGTGTAILSGDTELAGRYQVEAGTLALGSASAAGDGSLVVIFPGGQLDASPLSVPLPLTDQSSIHGILGGDVVMGSGSLRMGGVVTGDLDTSPDSTLILQIGGSMVVGGDFHLHPESSYRLALHGTAPGLGYNRARIGGTVSLEGVLDLGYPQGLALGDSLVVLLNDGDDAVEGQFKDLPEGATIPIDGGLALQITYQANGDGGQIGNDIGFAVVTGPYLSDRQLTAHSPAAVGMGQQFTIGYVLRNEGPSTLSDGKLVVTLPPDLTFVGSTVAGTLDRGNLEIPVSLLPPGSETEISLWLDAPSALGQVTVDAEFTSGLTDPVASNHSTRSVFPVMAPGAPVLAGFTHDAAEGSTNLSLYALPGVEYVLEGSDDLVIWEPIETFTGTGQLYSRELPVDEQAEFFRFRVLSVPGE